MRNAPICIPPLKIQGIKSKIVPHIQRAANINKDTLWIEPFMGSGVVGFNVAPKNAVFSDLNPHIINFYNELKNGEINSSKISEFLYEEGKKLAKFGERYYYAVRERFNERQNSLDFLFLNRACFNGMMRFNKNNKFNVPYGHKPNRFAKAYITKILNQVKFVEMKLALNNWSFLCLPFEKTLSMADERSFIYCDPPYIDRHVDYYDSWDETEERKLHEALEASKAMYMISTWAGNVYRKNPYIDTLWGNCNKIFIEHFYFLGGKEKNRNAMTEALLTNYFIDSDIDMRENVFQIPVYEQLRI